jgi:hypothetical protein
MTRGGGVVGLLESHEPLGVDPIGFAKKRLGIGFQAHIGMGLA